MDPQILALFLRHHLCRCHHISTCFLAPPLDSKIWPMSVQIRRFSFTRKNRCSVKRNAVTSLKLDCRSIRLFTSSISCWLARVIELRSHSQWISGSSIIFNSWIWMEASYKTLKTRKAINCLRCVQTHFRRVSIHINLFRSGSGCADSVYLVISILS